MSPNRPPRLEGFAYVGLYQCFVTICTDQRQIVFGADEHARWLTAQIVNFFMSKKFEVIAYCVMPDHVHVLLEGLTETADFQAAMHDWKQVTAFAWKQRTGKRLWQSGFYEHVLREEERVPGVVKYILENPTRAGLTKDGVTYPYMGSSRYSLEQLGDAVADWSPRRRRDCRSGGAGGSEDPPLRVV